MTGGILYVADESHVGQAAESAASASREMPDVPIAVATDAASAPPVFDRRVEIEIDEWDWDLRIDALARSPFDRTLYLDTDTFVAGDVSAGFDLLDEHDFAAAHAPVRRVSEFAGTDFSWSTPPDSFPEFNCGVVYYADTEAVETTFSHWKERYREYREVFPDVHDQPAFRAAVYDGPASIAALPPEYNCRLPFHGYASDDVKVIHGPADNYEHVAARLNSRSGPRTFRCVSVGNSWGVLFGPGPVRTWLAKLELLVREKSVQEVLSWAGEKL